MRDRRTPRRPMQATCADGSRIHGALCAFDGQACWGRVYGMLCTPVLPSLGTWFTPAHPHWRSRQTCPQLRSACPLSWCHPLLRPPVACLCLSVTGGGEMSEVIKFPLHEAPFVGPKALSSTCWRAAAIFSNATPRLECHHASHWLSVGSNFQLFTLPASKQCASACSPRTVAVCDTTAAENFLKGGGGVNLPHPLPDDRPVFGNAHSPPCSAQQHCIIHQNAIDLGLGACTASFRCTVCSCDPPNTHTQPCPSA